MEFNPKPPPVTHVCAGTHVCASDARASVLMRPAEHATLAAAEQRARAALKEAQDLKEAVARIHNAYSDKLNALDAHTRSAMNASYQLAQAEECYARTLARFELGGDGGGDAAWRYAREILAPEHIGIVLMRDAAGRPEQARQAVLDDLVAFIKENKIPADLWPPAVKELFEADPKA